MVTRTRKAPKKASDVQAAAAVDGGPPFGQAMQSLFALAGQMRNMNPEGDGTSLNPKLILTGTGLELRFTETNASAEPEPTDRLGEIERSLKLLSARIGKLEEQLGSQNEVVCLLRGAVQQNEEMMESLVDSLSMMDELDPSELGLELVPGPDSIAS